MAWLESHGNLARHPKTRRLMQRMGWTLPSTIGNLHLLWWWALDFTPTGDLSRFEPEQFTYDLDLNGSTPEQFIEAMVEAGFLDREESGTLRLHDWPEYTAKSLRPRFRRDPERWHQVLRSYGLPVITYTRRTSSRHGGSEASGAERNQNALRAVCRQPSSETARKGALYPDQSASIDASRDSEISELRPNENPALSGVQSHSVQTTDLSQTEPDATRAPSLDLPTEQQMANMRKIKGEYEPQGAVRIDCVEDAARKGAESGGERSQIPRSLSLVPGFVDKWWPKLLAMYETKGALLDCRQRKELLARLSYRPNSATRLLEHCIKNSLDCKWEHLDNSA